LESSHLRGEILVPFPIESVLSGVKCALQSDETLIYQRIFSIPVAWDGKCTLLHFGAVDWEAKGFVNGRPVGRHVGGYLPFWFDITDMLVEGENELIVCVFDTSDTHWQQRGKQVLKPKTIWYTAVLGIWQTVWLEPVTQTYISRLKIIPDVDGSFVCVKAILAGSQLTANRLDVRVLDTGKPVAVGESTPSETEIRIPIPNPILWSPDPPHLYDLEITSGEDQVDSYFGMRKFSIEDKRLCLNNQPLFQFGSLDQGYWPDGLYTPPSDEAMHWDIELVKKLGCNMLRKHVKVEPARYYHYCEIMGIIVWQDMPKGGAVVDEMRMCLENLVNLPQCDRNYRLAGRDKSSSREDFKRELCEMVDHLHNFTCIGMCLPFNEA
jgi:beta-galactosidase/beta-glucuronidase